MPIEKNAAAEKKARDSTAIRTDEIDCAQVSTPSQKIKTEFKQSPTNYPQNQFESLISSGRKAP
jgi:hypothetical protein